MPYPPDRGCATLLRDEAQALRLLDGLGAVAHLELAIERRGVLLDRVGGEEERAGDLTVGGAARDRLQDFALALGERRPGRGLVRLEDGHAEPDHAPRARDVRGRP